MGMEIKRGNASSKLRSLATRVERQTWRDDVERAVIDHERQTFKTAGASQGTPWRALSGPYAARKSRAMRRPVLVVTGSLRASLTGQGPYWKSDPTGSGLVIGTRHPLAHLHHRGSKGRQVPARPLIKATPALRREIATAVRRSVCSTNPDRWHTDGTPAVTAPHLA